jgi:hypothetical protein
MVPGNAAKDRAGAGQWPGTGGGGAPGDGLGLAPGHCLVGASGDGWGVRERRKVVRPMRERLTCTVSTTDSKG